MLRPSPNHGTQRLPNDDDDDWHNVHVICVSGLYVRVRRQGNVPRHGPQDRAARPHSNRGVSSDGVTPHCLFDLNIHVLSV